MTYIDPLNASPDNYKLLLQEGNRRMVEMTLPAGTSDITHSHPAELVYFVKGSKVKIHVENGDAMEADIPDGHVMAHEAWTHRVENIGDHDLKAIIFEVMP